MFSNSWPIKRLVLNNKMTAFRGTNSSHFQNVEYCYFRELHFSGCRRLFDFSISVILPRPFSIFQCRGVNLMLILATLVSVS